MNSKYSLGTLLISLIISGTSAKADFLCHNSISYEWKKTQEEAQLEVFWARLERKGSDEAAGKRALEDAVAPEKIKAFDGCQQAHENLAGCVSSKFTALAGTLERLSFSQRKSIEDAVNSDCAARIGKCGQVKVSEAICSIIVSAASSSSSSADAKDAKKKK